jgi:tartrate dehydrogenase/decarboxylase / D-malate dehydrogenase
VPRSYRIAVIPGDGIGREVVPAAIEVLEAAGRLYDFELDLHELPWSCEYYTETGQMMPSDGLEQLRGYRAIFLGAVGYPGVADDISLWGLLIPIRRAFHQYVNLRPVKLLEGVRSPLRSELTEAGIDFVIVRENNEGEYSEVGGRLYRDTPQEFAIQEAIFTRSGVERIARYAFELAAQRRNYVMSATKSNGIIHTLPFWDQVVAEIGAGYPAVRLEKMHVDALAAAFVQRPASFDVVLGSNLFADILSDLGAAVAGSIGIAPSGNIDPTGEYPSMFEPVHGSAPDIAGRGIANPIGQIWSGAMMLRHLGERDAADAIERAFEEVLRDGHTLTADLGGRADMAAVTEAVLGALRGPASA